MLCDDVICFHPARKSHSSLYIGTAFSFLSNGISVKTQFKENPKTLKTTEETTEVNKHDLANGQENEAQSPWKNLEGGQFAVFTKKSRFLTPAKQN